MLSDSYHINRIIGKGQYAEVFEGTQKSSGFPIAAKVYKGAIRNNMICDELNMLEKIFNLQASRPNGPHPNIVNVITTEFKTQGEWFGSTPQRTVVMELLNGGEMYNRVKPCQAPFALRPLSERDTAQMVCSLVDGLHFLHSNKIIHRDLKPENVVYRSKVGDEYSEPVIVDFGFSVIGSSDSGGSNSATGMGDIYHKSTRYSRVGTPGYMAPEIYRDGLYSNKTDIWSLGVITYISLVGFPPLGNNDPQLEQKTLKGINSNRHGLYSLNNPEWEGVSQEAKDFVKRLLNDDPNERPCTSKLFQDPWLLKHTGLNTSVGTSPDTGSVSLSRKHAAGGAVEKVCNSAVCEDDEGDSSDATWEISMESRCLSCPSISSSSAYGENNCSTVLSTQYYDKTTEDDLMESVDMENGESLAVCAEEGFGSRDTEKGCTMAEGLTTVNTLNTQTSSESAMSCTMNSYMYDSEGWAVSSCAGNTLTADTQFGSKVAVKGIDELSRNMDQLQINAIDTWIAQNEATAGMYAPSTPNKNNTCTGTPSITSGVDLVQPMASAPPAMPLV